MFKKPMRGWLWYCVLNPTNFQNHLKDQILKKQWDLVKVEKLHECFLRDTDICDSEKPVETVFLDEEITREQGADPARS